AIRLKERNAALDRLEGYAEFSERIRTMKADFLEFVAQAKADGQTIAAYGAAAKGNTFLNYCGLTRDDIACVLDRSIAKQGRLMPGSHIPVVAPERLTEWRPDVLAILPWNLADEIVAVNSALTSWGGRFVVAIPQLRIFS